MPCSPTGAGNFAQDHPKIELGAKVVATLTTLALAAVAVTAFLHIGAFAQHAQLGATYVGIGTAAGAGVLTLGLISYIIYSCKHRNNSISTSSNSNSSSSDINDINDIN
nr:hypothetical protein [Chlamydiota bacterium]